MIFFWFLIFDFYLFRTYWPVYLSQPVTHNGVGRATRSKGGKGLDLQIPHSTRPIVISALPRWLIVLSYWDDHGMSLCLEQPCCLMTLMQSWKFRWVNWRYGINGFGILRLRGYSVRSAYYLAMWHSWRVLCTSIWSMALTMFMFIQTLCLPCRQPQGHKSI